MSKRRIAVGAALFVAACRGTEPFVAHPTSIVVSPPSAAFTALGATRRFGAAVLDQQGDTIPNATVQWVTLDAAVATVDGTGLVTAKAVGATQIQATLSQSSGALVGSTDVTVTQVPRRITKVSGDAQADTVSGTLAPLVLRVEDSLGHPIPGIAVGFAVTQGGGSVSSSADTSDAGGLASTTWTLGGTPGVNTLAVTVPAGGVGPVTFTASAVAAGTVPTVASFAGDGQTGLIGFAVNVPPAVRVRSSTGTPLAGRTVVFTVTAGGGTLTGATAVSDGNGVARVGSWSLTSGANALTAMVQDTGLITGNPVTFSATGAPKRYHVDVRFLTAMTPSQQAAFTSAASRWETVIFGDVPDVPVSIAAGRCGSNSPALNETIDDVVIFASIDSIDGPAKILGQAGPCATRSGSRFPLLGVMEFDSADVAALQAAGQFDLVIEHEMGHVLGVGTIWGSLLVGAGGSDPHFVGAQAQAEFDQVGGTAFVGSTVPVENCCGAGTRDSHWRETTLKSELMTGFLNSGANPLSVVTTASMGDLGYLVNYAGSDPYLLTLPLVSAPAAPARPLGNDVLRLPLMEIDLRGRILRIQFPR